MNYYNEFDPNAAAWLRELIDEKIIPQGHVDTRSILEVSPSDLAGFTQCHFFAGVGGWAEALRLAGVPIDVPVWTGSCPCQPFSSAGKQKGTEDERHLWPEFRRLIAECRPPTVFGEQVASRLGREWLSGVRADLERLGYAVGGADLCAAGVGAPHIRQRLYWGAVRLADPGVHGGSPRISEPEQREARESEIADHDLHRGVGGVADADGRQPRDGGVQPGGEHGQQSQDGCARGLEHAPGDGREQRGTEPGGRGAAGGRESGGVGNSDGSGREALRSERVGEGPGSPEFEDPSTHGDFWSHSILIPCRDGKARRVEPTIFPLAHGVQGRVGLLRGAGNAIVPQVAAAFVTAFLACSASLPLTA